ncbi:MAG TPA: folylpolyglutamate synthase/dihydrofolate synthase family protein [Bacillota bacterium]|nr:folylpolyglutamate synthase/dihydrofolate synthase family protein [Bacillota bacterium]
MTHANIPIFLQSANRFGISLGLVRMQALLKALHSPEKDLQVIHIAGTNGKGSVSAYCASILAGKGQKVGLFTSPFLERFNERIRVINGRDGLSDWETTDSAGEIDNDSLQSLSDEVEAAVRIILKDGIEHPTEFELVTAVAFLWFQRQKCDVCVLETGLGGRLDSTNVIVSPLCTIITALGYDHMDRLGDTMDKIAAEKGGIIKPHCPIFMMDNEGGDLSCEEAQLARETIMNIASERQAPLTIISKGDIHTVETTLDGQTFSYCGNAFVTRLIGRYQEENAALAVESMRLFATDEEIRYGLAHTKWKGRMEKLSDKPIVMIDGAHNPQGILSLLDTVNEIWTDKTTPTEWVIGVMKDKDVSRMIHLLMEKWPLPVNHITLVRPTQQRAMAPEELKRAFEKEYAASSAFYNREMPMYNAIDKIRIVEDARIGARTTMEEAKSNGSHVFVFGSLYLLGEVRATLIEALKAKEKDEVI